MSDNTNLLQMNLNDDNETLKLTYEDRKYRGTIHINCGAVDPSTVSVYAIFVMKVYKAKTVFS